MVCHRTRRWNRQGIVPLAAGLHDVMRYGENPHQAGSVLFQWRAPAGGCNRAQLLQGKQLSYNNINDTDAAFELVSEFDREAGGLRNHQACQSVRSRRRG
jgi:AICAR transformylase/IMP cyclohydrolase PurH